MKPIIPVLALLVSAAHGQLVITEVMASSSHPKRTAPIPDADGDWWELTNAGASAVSLNGFKWDDVSTPASPNDKDSLFQSFRTRPTASPGIEGVR